MLFVFYSQIFSLFNAVVNNDNEVIFLTNRMYILIVTNCNFIKK